MRKILNFITSISIWGVVFLVPLAFSPWTFEAFEFNKLYLLFFLVLIGTIAWLAKMVFVDREIRLKRTPLDIPIILFATLANISSFFSSDRWSSMFGYYGRFSDSAMALGSFVGLYFLIINTVEKPQRLLNWFLGAVAIVIATSYLSLFQVWQQFSVSVWPMIKQVGFNPVSASLEGFSVFLAAIAAFLAFQSVKPEVRVFSRIGYGVLALGGLGILLLADISKAWVVLLLGLLFALVAGFMVHFRASKKGGMWNLWFPFSLLLFAVVFLFSPAFVSTSIRMPAVPQEPMLSQELSWSIAWNTATEDIKHILVGSGPGTFAIDFSKYRPAEFNTGGLWQTRFDRSQSHWSEILATTGFLGILSYILLIGFFLLASWLLLSKKNMWPFLVVLLSLLVSQFVYYQTLSLGLAFWLFLALGVLSWERPVQEFVFSLRKFPEFEIGAKVLFLAVALVAGGMSYNAARFYLADTHYLLAQNTGRSGSKDPSGSMRGVNIARSIDHGLEAIRLNPYQAEYKMFASRSYLSRALAELQKPESERDQAGISRDVQLAIAHATRATQMSPKRVATWETQGSVYRDIKLAAGALEWGISSFETAIVLEPTNPILHTELGKLYAANEQNDKAKEQFEKAAALKADYVEAQLQLALIFEKEKDVPGAIAKIKAIALQYPLDAESLFQLGRLQYNNGQVQEAVSQFEQVLLLAPANSNARFALGVALEKQGKIEQAVQEFKRVLELNPGNEAVLQKLQGLEK
ncbi:MAG: tetratricopeptide repeat protein [bacterium]|nr:tetratricopeptide repeat protein [bacterium]